MSDDMTASITVSRLRLGFSTGKTKPLKWRKSQLENLLRMFVEEEAVFCHALREDLRKHHVESILYEIELVRNALRTMIFDLDSWAGDEYVEKNLVTLLDTTYVRREPLGVCLIIGAWNYPIQLSMIGAAGALCAGNCVLVKPSELSPATSRALKTMCEKYLDAETFAVVEGGVPETTELLKQRFDHIMFTGGLTVAKVVAKAAAEHLTPCTFELGGKCPLYIDDSVDMYLAAKRLVWGKCVNLGQTCVAPDYVLCSKATQDKLLPQLDKVFREFFGEVPQNSPDLSRIINERHYDRLFNLIQTTKADLVQGGTCIEKDRFIDLHVYTNVTMDDPIMGEEIFGPILPVVRVEDPHDAVNIINAGGKPLSLYVFSSSKSVRDTLITQTSSGSVCVNDVIVHLSVETLPFGGVGASGYGAYHGKYTFDTFSHRKAVLVRDFGFIGENLGKFRYCPYTEQNKNMALNLLKRRSFPLPPTRSFVNFMFVCVGAAIAVGIMQVVKVFE